MVVPFINTRFGRSQIYNSIFSKSRSSNPKKKELTHGNRPYHLSCINLSLRAEKFLCTAIELSTVIVTTLKGRPKSNDLQFVPLIGFSDPPSLPSGLTNPLLFCLLL